MVFIDELLEYLLKLDIGAINPLKLLGLLTGKDNQNSFLQYIHIVV
jgi:hypothetical protein